MTESEITALIASNVTQQNSTDRISGQEVRDVLNALNVGKVEKINGKGLSTNDFTETQETKLNNIGRTITKAELDAGTLPAGSYYLDYSVSGSGNAFTDLFGYVNGSNRIVEKTVEIKYEKSDIQFQYIVGNDYKLYQRLVNYTGTVIVDWALTVDLSTKQTKLSQNTYTTTNSDATIEPNFQYDLYKVKQTTTAVTAIDNYANMPTAEDDRPFRNLIIQNDSGSSSTIVFRTSDLVGSVTFQFKFMGGTASSTAVVANGKWLDIVYTLSWQSATSCIVEITYKIQE